MFDRYADRISKSAARFRSYESRIAPLLLFGRSTGQRRGIGIGGSLAAPPLPHHRTYGSVYGGSVGYTPLTFWTRSTPSQSQNLFGSAMLSATLRLRRHGPCRVAMVRTASSRFTPRFINSATRRQPVFQCFSTMQRRRRLIHASRSPSTLGVWQ